MGRLTIAMRIGLVWVIISFLFGCTLKQERVRTPEWIYPNNGFQSKKIEQLTAKLNQSRQANLALKKENETLKIDRSSLMNANSKIKEYNKALTMKIDMLKILDHRVEEKRKNYIIE